MLKQYKIQTTTEQVVIIDETGKITVTSSKVVSTNIIGDNNQVQDSIKYQFSNSESKYGIVTFKKSNPLRSLYSPNESVNVSINGLTATGKWHASQARVDGLTTLFNNFSNLEARVFNLFFDPLSNTLVFNEI